MKGNTSIFAATLLALLFVASPVLAQTRLSVHGAGKLYPIAIPRLCTQNADVETISTIPEVLSRDLSLSGYFKVTSPNTFIASENCSSPDDVAYSDWSVIGVDGLVKGVVERVENGNVRVRLFLHDVQLRKTVLAKEFTGKPDQAIDMAHRFANLIMKFFTGEEGVFGTRIVYTGRVGRFKELFMMDMDGSNIRQLTRDNGLSMFADWDPAGERVVFTGYRNRQPDIFVLDSRSRNIQRVTSSPLLEVGPKFSPDGRSILMARSSGKTSELVVTDLRGTLLRQITRSHGAISVSGDWSPDGQQVVYVSNRSGGPQIYIIRIGDSDGRRISRVNSGYCTSPAWSPTGERIAFVCQADGGYQVFTSRPDGSDAFQITGNGSNEDPSWAPDGRYLVFSTTAGTGGVKKLAIVKNDGSGFKILTSGRAEESDPVWGPRTLN